MPLVARHAASRPRRTALRRTGLGLLAVVVLATSTVAFSLHRLSGNVTSAGELGALVVVPSTGPSGTPTVGPDEDPWAGGPLTFVAIGTDDRSGENADVGGFFEGMRSDATLVVHVSADRDRVDVVSIPRDSLVDIPSCHLDRDPDGAMSAPQTDKFNEAFAVGGTTGDVGLAAACLLSTVAENTGLVITEFALLDFVGFHGMVDAVGGVRVCVPEPLRDTHDNTDLDLDAGWHTLKGVEALDYVRARYVTGSDNSDIQRMDRQQTFIGALARKVVSEEVLTSPLSVRRFLDAATRSLTASEQLTRPANIGGLAWALRDLDPSQITFTTVPWGSTDDGIVWTPEADLVWQRLAADLPLVDEPAGGAAGGSDDEGGGGGPGSGGEEGSGDGQDSGSEKPSIPEPDITVRTGVDPDEELCGPA